ncbi:MAG: CDGSH iron-sulfur domain-containing protein, partial [bacterium]
MAAKIHEYAGDKIIVRYDVKRCIHAEECVHGLPVVFKRNERRWIQPEGATADEVAAVVMCCPTGALHFERKDEGKPETIPDENVVRVSPNGPLYIRGDIVLTAPDGSIILEDTRVALCRCGASKNKPFCDNSHLDISFQDYGIPPKTSPIIKETIVTNSQPLRITPLSNAPLQLEGEMEIWNAAGEAIFHGDKASLCRCGGSK